MGIRPLREAVNKRPDLRGHPEPDFTSVKHLQVREIYDQNETPLDMLPLNSVQPVQPYMAWQSYS